MTEKKDWRPEGLEMLYKKTVLTQTEFEKAEKQGGWKDDYNPILDAQAQKSFKAGASAMLEAIRKIIRNGEGDKWGCMDCGEFMDDSEEIK